MGTPKSSREKTADYRRRQREKGLRLVQFWVPDTRSPEFIEEARSAIAAIKACEQSRDDDAFVQALADELLQSLPEE